MSVLKSILSNSLVSPWDHAVLKTCKCSDWLEVILGTKNDLFSLICGTNSSTKSSRFAVVYIMIPIVITINIDIVFLCDSENSNCTQKLTIVHNKEFSIAASPIRRSWERYEKISIAEDRVVRWDFDVPFGISQKAIQKSL